MAAESINPTMLNWLRANTPPKGASSRRVPSQECIYVPIGCAVAFSQPVRYDEITLTTTADQPETGIERYWREHDALERKFHPQWTPPAVAEH